VIGAYVVGAAYVAGAAYWAAYMPAFGTICIGAAYWVVYWGCAAAMYDVAGIACSMDPPIGYAVV